MVLAIQIASKTQRRWHLWGKRANKRKKDTKIMFLSRVSHLVLLQVLSDPDNTRSERLDFAYLMSAPAEQLM